MIKQERQRLFWIYQALGWGGMSLYNLIMRGYFSHFFFGELVNSVVSGICLFISTSLLVILFKTKLKFDKLARTILTIIMLAIVSSILAQLLYGMVVIPNQQAIYGQEIGLGWLELLMALPNMLLVTLVWASIYVLVQKQLQLQLANQNKTNLINSLKSAQLDLLMSQINPHFIFNAINNIRSLINEDSEKSRLMLANLSDVMRYTMQHHKKLVIFRNELDVVESYLSINQLQYEKRLQLQWSIDEQTLEYLIPKMLLQLMVENAIKHGIGKLRHGGRIEISAYVEADIWYIVVKNSGELKLDKRTNTGIGIDNIKKRLKLIYKDKAYFTLEQGSHFVVATVGLPVGGDYCV